MKRYQGAGGRLACLLFGLGLAHAGTALATDPRTPTYCNANSATDWPAPSPYSRSIQPMDCAVISHDPPVLAWPSANTTAPYEVKLVTAAGVTTLKETVMPWLYWPTKLGAGDYSWFVRIKGATAWSSERRFRIAAGALDFTIPNVNDAWTKALKLPHPRTLPAGTERAAWVADWTTGARKVGWYSLRSRVERKVTDVLPLDPSSTTVAGSATATIAAANLAFMNQMNKLSDAAREAALLAVIEKKAFVLADAKRRTLHLARLNPTGATSWSAEPGSGRRLVWSLAQCYDWLYYSFTESERAEIRNAVRLRVPPMLATLTDPSQGIVKKPLSSFANESLPDTLVIAAAVAESNDPKDPVATTMTTAEYWYKTVYPMMFAWLSPWGGDDGGFANGTNYLIWNIEVGENWDMLRWITGVDITRKTWTRNLGRTMVYFAPPGSPFGAFGDGAERDNTEANDRLFRPYAARVKDPLYNWYSGQLFGGDESRIMVLFAPPGVRGGALPAGTPNSIVLPSVGWAAMHSDLANRLRTSVYFKSSAYGSYDHSHADQNSFMIAAKGRALAVETGMYDYYGSSININWTKTTGAHNAITFDGGIGQSQAANGRGDVTARGTIQSFSSTAEVDIVSGLADGSYGNGVTKARRSVVYVRPSTVLVFDTLAATTAKRWEWNIHGAVKPSAADASSFTLKNVDTTLCGKVYSEGPLALSAITPPTGATPITQWHGRYGLATPLTNATFAASMSIDCAAPPPTPVRKPDGSWTVTGPTWIVTYKDGVATYAKK
ncbi:hypothetical protein CSQ96_09380 [Janthinobacterium sp. BJB412]|nr:hypothetical protein CSQ96_09380 [Janthinobacterium sp. BJB412]